jgi:hypothetical protein
VLSAQGLWAGSDLYRATPAVTRDLGFSGLIWRTTPFSRLLRFTSGCGESILTRILTGLHDFEDKNYWLTNTCTLNFYNSAVIKTLMDPLPVEYALLLTRKSDIDLGEYLIFWSISQHTSIIV